ncbi:uncharacterized protein LOC129757538 isoform X1 [Uranotaenia lowii]|uniref:uncharacterized protein LOC129757538 isoform X1 n=2 Tax=Uranotaenia lowii TaxID=190385 RepID=UPI0024797944|nr:uncharacterized protein LOC129757538 isoform X1 [Uranotaenia lowii]
MAESSSESDSCSSLQTDSESDQETNGDEPRYNIEQVDYTATAKDIICENVNITTDNALNLNSGYHNMLKTLRNKLEILLAQCQERQSEIDQQLEAYKNARKPEVGKSRTSGYICGQPYFKDEDLYPGPHNDDYLRRKNVYKEFFPLDMFEITDTNWTVKDKVNILKGVKTQIIEFIERENKLKIKKLGNGLEAERLRREFLALQGKDIGELWEKVKNFPTNYPGQKFELDWLRISNINISGRHSVASCIGIWNNYMIPGLVRSSWKAAEEKKLLAAVKKYNRQDWSSIAKEVPGRSGYQCFVHYQTTFSDLAQIKHERWTAEEDARLIRVVDENRIGSNIIWNKVVENMPLRNKVQCYNRYKFTLMRPTKNAKFTPEEDCIITAYVQERGDDFRFMPPNLLPGRSTRQIWARYHHTLKYVNKHSGWTIEDDMRLMNFIKENLTEEGPKKISWAACAKVMSNRSRLSCRTRYYTIERFLEKNPDATLDDVPRRDKNLSSNVTNDNWMSKFMEMRKDGVPTENNKQQPSTSRTKEKTPKVKKVPLFSSTLRCPFKKRLYEKFKYCYHFKFGNQTPNTALVNHHINVILELLNCSAGSFGIESNLETLSASELATVKGILNVHLNPSFKAYLASVRYCFYYPPNYDTIIGLRGVVLNAYYPHFKGQEQPINLQKTDPDYENTLEKFRARFRSLFFWTMCLMQQNASETNFQEAQPETVDEYQMIEKVEMHHDLTYVESVSLQKLPPMGRIVEESSTELVPTTVCLDQLNLGANRQVERASSLTRDLRNFHPTNVRTPEPPLNIEPRTEVQHSYQSNNNYQPVPSTAIETILPQQQLVPVSIQYGSTIYYQPVQTQVDSFVNVQPPSYQTFGQFIPAPSCSLPGNNLVSQITVINPEDLPAVNLQQQQQPLSMVEVSETSNDQQQTGTDFQCDENDSDEYDSTENLPSANHYYREPSSLIDFEDAIDRMQDSGVPVTAQDEKSGRDSEIQAQCSIIPTSLAQKLVAQCNNSSHVKYVTNIGDFVIEELHETNPNGKQMSSPVVNETPSSGPCNIESGIDTNENNSGIIPIKTETSSCTEEPEVVNRTEKSLVEKRTYSRGNRHNKIPYKHVKEMTVYPSHAWRWDHVAEVDGELHFDLWESCDPFRTRFNMLKDDEILPRRRKSMHQEVIVIDDDDDIDIKEEPLDLDEMEGLPEEPNEQVSNDVNCIQEIIQTASNILRISETYKLMQARNSTDDSGPSTMPPPASLACSQPMSDLLMVQTPSRIFDEESNCYYYVDEVQENSLNEANVHIVSREYKTEEDAQFESQSNLAGMVQQSLEATYPVMPSFSTPYRVPPSMPGDSLQEWPSPEQETDSISLNKTPSTYSRNVHRRQTVQVEIVPVPQVPEPIPGPSIRKPKRPPRSNAESPSAEQQRGIQEKALTLLDALYRNNSKRTTPIETPTAKRPRLEEPEPEPVSVSIKIEPQDDTMVEELVDAVDIISALSNLRDSSNEQVNEEELEFLRQLDRTPKPPAISLVPVAPKPPKVSEQPSTSTWRTATQEKVHSIIQNSANRSAMNIRFKIGELTIQKVQPK